MSKNHQTVLQQLLFRLFDETNRKLCIEHQVETPKNSSENTQANRRKNSLQGVVKKSSLLRQSSLNVWQQSTKKHVKIDKTLFDITQIPYQIYISSPESCLMTYPWQLVDKIAMKGLNGCNEKLEICCLTFYSERKPKTNNFCTYS